MKKLLYFLFFSLFAGTKCSAQIRLVPGESKVGKEIFIIHAIPSMAMDTQKYIVVSSKSNLYNNGIPFSKDLRHIPMNPRNIHINSTQVDNLIYQAFGTKLNALKDRKETLGIIFIFKPDGSIVDVSFSLHYNTIITLEDIEAIDKALRANIKATFTGREYLQQEAISGDIKTIVF
jgi:hypothetical protein